MRLAKRLLVGTGLIGIGLAASVAAQADKNRGADVLSELLSEVRGLRQAMEQMASAGPRVQLALGRLQLQEQRVNTMIRRLETIRADVAKAEKEQAQSQAQLAQFEGMFKQNPGDVEPGKPNPMAGMLEMFRQGVAASETEIQRLQLEEAQLQQQIAAEQGRWSEINRALEELERTLQKR
jgi:chromosome segregation ATPase